MPQDLTVGALLALDSYAAWRRGYAWWRVLGPGNKWSQPLRPLILFQCAANREIADEWKGLWFSFRPCSRSLVSVVYTCIVVSEHVGVQDWVFCLEWRERKNLLLWRGLEMTRLDDRSKLFVYTKCNMQTVLGCMVLGVSIIFGCMVLSASIFLSHYWISELCHCKERTNWCACWRVNHLKIEQIEVVCWRVNLSEKSNGVLF
jgi:hypothetical protein